MSIVFNIILHILLLSSLLLFMIVLLATAFTQTDRLERLLRVAAIFAGAMVALGATASGVNYATYTVNALSQARPASAAAHFVSILIPALIGSGLGFYLVRAIRRSETLAIRILGFVGMLATTAFIEVYAEAAGRNGFRLGAAALPNIGFTAGVILTVVFTLRTDDSGAHNRGSSLNALASALRRKSATGESKSPATPGSHAAPGYRPAPGSHAARPPYAPGQFDDSGFRGL